MQEDKIGNFISACCCVGDFIKVYPYSLRTHCLPGMLPYSLQITELCSYWQASILSYI